MPATTRYAIGDLATLGGVSRRTVRYYVQEGLIPKPLSLGRGQHYTAEHLEQLLRVKIMQEAGGTLEDIRRTLTASGQRTAEDSELEGQAVSRTLWRHIRFAPGVELHVASTVGLPPPAKLRELAVWCRRNFVTEARGREEHEDRHA